jgi:hypothetical protein
VPNNRDLGSSAGLHATLARHRRSPVKATGMMKSRVEVVLGLPGGLGGTSVQLCSLVGSGMVSGSSLTGITTTSLTFQSSPTVDSSSYARASVNTFLWVQ